jgi:tripartite-type tricarboxylate transporter receptor subunit TctC
LHRIDPAFSSHKKRNRQGGVKAAMRGMRRFNLNYVLAFIALVASAGVSSGIVLAQDKFPSRALRIVTPLAAGSASDIALRFLADRLSLRFNVPVVVENQTGAGGVTAARSVINAPHDGYTIAWLGNNTAISVSLFAQPFDPRKEAKPIVGVSEFAYLFVTNAASTYKALQDVISAARSKPGTLNVGTSSAGTSNHLTALLFKSVLGLDIVIVPYRGPSELSIALLRNDIDIVVNAYGGLRQGIEGKQIRALATTSSGRLDELPDVPTMAEAGVPDFEISSWNALYAPANAPELAVDTVRKAVTEILSQNDVKAKYREIGFTAQALPPDVQDKRMRSEIERWAKVIADSGIERR